MNPHVNLSKLLALRSIRHDPIISALENAILLGENGMQERNECCSRLITAAENLGLKGNLLSRYLLHVIIYRSNIVSEIMERTGLPPGNSLRHIFYRDIALLHPLLITPTSNFLGEKILDDYEPTKKHMIKRKIFCFHGLRLQIAQKTMQRHFSHFMHVMAAEILPRMLSSIGMNRRNGFAASHILNACG